MIPLASGNSIRIVPRSEVAGYVDRNLLAVGQVTEASCNKTFFVGKPIFDIIYNLTVI